MTTAALDTGLTKFPAFAPPDTLSTSTYSDAEARTRSPDSRISGNSPERNPLNLQLRPSLDTERIGAHWSARRSSRAAGGPSHSRGFSRGRHGRQRSLSEAIQVIRERNGSMSQNAQEIADALRAPVSPRLVILCAAWYATSMLSNTSAGQILATFPKPVTLTIIQFAFVTSWCLVLSYLATLYPSLKTAIPALRNGIRPPTRDLITTTLPLTGFMIGGHILTSDAMSRIPVSLVHTIKGLSPLFTVFAYRFIFRVRYHYTTYLSLFPLTIGVVMACSTQKKEEFNNNLLGLCSAFASAILFVTQNIVSKKLFNDAALAENEVGPPRARKPDKLNLLCYSSALAFAFTAPIWLWTEGFSILGDFLHDASVDLSTSHEKSLGSHSRLALEYLFNGTFHFAQSLVAFTLLSMVSPVTYSVASLIKRVFVICFAIIWFGNKVSQFQGVGIGFTFLGLYLYDRTSDHGRAEKKARGAVRLNGGLAAAPLLPLHEVPTPGLVEGEKILGAHFAQSPVEGFVGEGAEEEKRRVEAAVNAGVNRTDAAAGWLAPGTKAEETWISGDGAGDGGPGPVVGVS